MAYDSPHYFNDGYLQAASWAFPQVRRDLYGYTDTLGLRSPNIKKAYFSDKERNEIILQFDEAALWPERDSVVNGVVFSMAKNIFLDTISYTGADSTHPFLCVDSGYSIPEEKKIILKLVGSIPSVASPQYISLSYQYTGSLPGASEPVEWISPYIKNSKGAAALTFWRFPVSDSQTTTQLEAATASGNIPTMTVLPNPYMGSFSMRFIINNRGANDEKFSLSIYDVKGKLIRTIHDNIESGAYALLWDGRDSRGGAVPPSVYTAVARFGRNKMVKKIVVIK